MKKRSILLSVILVLLILLSSCSKLGKPAEQAENGAEEQVLLVWDQFYREEESKVIETLNAEFEAAHPGVRI